MELARENSNERRAAFKSESAIEIKSKSVFSRELCKIAEIKPVKLPCGHLGLPAAGAGPGGAAPLPQADP